MPNIYQNSVTDRMLGCLFQNPMLCLETKYKLDKDEFKANKFHQILYVTIYNLACSDYKTISIFDINSFLEPYTSQYEIYKDNNGDSYIDTIIELTDTSNFEAYYNEFKKLSCIRVYNENGFDISKFWNFEQSDEKNLENINQYNIEDIINYFEGLQTSIKRSFIQKKGI